MSNAPSTAAGSAQQPVFLRNTSGLVKSATGLDAFIFNVSVMSIGMGLLSVYLVVPAFNPGASVPLTWLIATAILVPIALAYYLWSVTLPRTGGNYVYLSRSMPLGLAVIFNYIELYTFLFFTAFAASFTAPVVAGTLWFLGAHSGNEWMLTAAEDLSGKWWTFGLGIATLAVGLAVQLRGTQTFFRIQRVLFPLALLTTVVMLIALLFVSADEFGRHFQSLTGASMDEVVKTATAEGFASPGFDLWATLKAVVWPVITMWAFFFSISFGGEIKSAKKGQFLGIVGSCVAFGVFACIASIIINGSIPIDQMGALVWNNTLGTGVSLPTLATVPTVAMIAVNSPVIAVLIGISFVLWVLFWATNIPSYCARTLFAHSIDRLAPAAIGYVTPRHRVPLGALLAAYGLATGFFILFVFTSFFAALAIGIPLFFAWIASLASGAILPKTRPTLWQRSPASAYRIGPLPLMSAACGLGVVILLAVEVLVYEDPSAVATSRNSLIAIGAIIALAVVAYVVMSQIRRRQGVELEQLTKEIPVE
jgi:amino acid transporter